MCGCLLKIRNILQCGVCSTLDDRSCPCFDVQANSNCFNCSRAKSITQLHTPMSCTKRQQIGTDAVLLLLLLLASASAMHALQDALDLLTSRPLLKAECLPYRADNSLSRQHLSSCAKTPNACRATTKQLRGRFHSSHWTKPSKSWNTSEHMGLR